MPEHTAAPAPVEPAKPEATDDFTTRRHATASGLRYTSTTGRMVLRREESTGGKAEGHRPKAEIFLVSYTADQAPTESPAAVNAKPRAKKHTDPVPAPLPNPRPVIFAFNGGPGSASVWLHMGLLGPRIVDSGDAGNMTPAPYGIIDNPETILEHADLVMIDPVNTGFSRVVDGGKDDEFHSFIEDRDLIAEVIRLWVTRNERWLSPKYLIGESYGTLRAVAVARRLYEAYGMAVNGLGLISTVLNMSTLDFAPGNDTPYALHLPTYAAIAHHHGRHGNRPLQEVVRDAEDYASGDYVLALHLGNRISKRKYDAAVKHLAELTTLSEAFIRRTDLRWDYMEFATELLREKGLMVGRIDGRFTGRPPRLQESHTWDDPSLRAIAGPYSAAINHYVRAELGYSSDLPYEVLTGRVQPWSYKTFEGVPVDVTRDLERLMVDLPHLRVHVDYGYHDGATPHFAAEYVWAHMNLGPEARTRLSHHYHAAGHMMYLNPACRSDQLSALAAFVAPAG
ncbi:S10 family peptidase [Paeniglutamicibacter cryotolerans]|uniref:Carboxypeptidase C (Cathepsin A) n=1 Tax=Paeniglutamicibacter cryotolerans TaxID=670079 RepID=A0A839QMV2_9MICC|nr:peptidase S10 [Paeniglutamicibacter cryotolerans]MBB2994542.1 carboxypeptidase C (cathepsin A) [Paeniglutamicibacter cryotolerans]